MYKNNNAMKCICWRPLSSKDDKEGHTVETSPHSVATKTKETNKTNNQTSKQTTTQTQFKAWQGRTHGSLSPHCTYNTKTTIETNKHKQVACIHTMFHRK